MGLERQGTHPIERGSGPSVGNDREEAQRDALRRLIQSGLSEPERLVVLLTYGEGLTIREIAGVLDLSEAAVRQAQTAIVSRLRAQLGWRVRVAADPAG